jgi:hypothetical protein
MSATATPCSGRPLVSARSGGLNGHNESSNSVLDTSVLLAVGAKALTAPKGHAAGGWLQGRGPGATGRGIRDSGGAARAEGPADGARHVTELPVNCMGGTMRVRRHADEVERSPISSLLGEVLDRHTGACGHCPDRVGRSAHRRR